MVVFGGRFTRCAVEKGLQVAFESDEFGDLRSDLVEAGAEYPPNVPARHLATIVDRQDLAHLVQGQSGRLAATDKLEPIHDLGSIVAIPGCAAWGLRQ